MIDSSYDPFETVHLRGWLDRLVRLRWLAIAAVAGAVALASLTALLRDTRPHWAVAVAMAIYNAGLWRWSSKIAARAEVARLQHMVFVQLLLDVLCLSVLLHFSDSVENPAVMFFAFPVAAAAMLLPPRLWSALAAAAALAHGGAVFLEYLGVVAHHPLAQEFFDSSDDPLFRSGFLVIGYEVTFVLTINGVAYLVYVVAREHRRADALRRQRERLAQSRERMARVGQIAAGVAHAVRNPVHGLINCVDLLRPQLAVVGAARSAVEAETASETLDLMGEALHRIEVVSRRLLALTRDAPPAPRLTAVDELVQDVLRLAAPGSEVRDVALITQLGAVGQVELDPDQIGEALANIVDNALAACAEGGTVTVATSRRWDNGELVAIEVSDTGAGIPADELGRVFDPFFTTKAIGAGTGLGLAIARRVVDDHGGEITVDSQLGSGTRVRVVLPRRQVGPTVVKETR